MSKAVGAAVFGGTVNGNGSLTVRVTKVGADTVLARIVHMVGEAQGAKLPVQALVDKVTGWFVPAVIAVAILTFILWFAFGPRPSLAFAVVNMVAVLIVACPCAMGLATPVSVMVAMGRSAQLGILFRDATALQTLRDVKTVAFDKTGTLTEGHPALTDIQVSSGFDEGEVVVFAAAVEALSEHPLGKALVAAAQTRGLTIPKADDFHATPGFGVAATIGGKAVAIGSARFMAKLGVDVANFDTAASQLSAAGKIAALRRCRYPRRGNLRRRRPHQAIRCAGPSRAEEGRAQPRDDHRRPQGDGGGGRPHARHRQGRGGDLA